MNESKNFCPTFLSTENFSAFLLHKSEWNTYSNVIINQLNDKKSKNQKKILKLKRQKHSGSWCVKSPMKNAELILNPLPMDI